MNPGSLRTLRSWELPGYRRKDLSSVQFAEYCSLFDSFSASFRTPVENHSVDATDTWANHSQLVTVHYCTAVLLRVRYRRPVISFHKDFIHLRRSHYVLDSDGRGQNSVTAKIPFLSWILALLAASFQRKKKKAKSPSSQYFSYEFAKGVWQLQSHPHVQMKAELLGHVTEWSNSALWLTSCSPVWFSVTRTLRRCSCNITELTGILSHTRSTEQTCHFSHLKASAISPQNLTHTIFFRPRTCYVSKNNGVFAALERWNSSSPLQAKSELNSSEKWEYDYFFYQSIFFSFKCIFERAGNIHFPVLYLGRLMHMSLLVNVSLPKAKRRLTYM